MRKQRAERAWRPSWYRQPRGTEAGFEFIRIFRCRAERAWRLERALAREGPSGDSGPFPPTCSSPPPPPPPDRESSTERGVKAGVEARVEARVEGRGDVTRVCMDTLSGMPAGAGA